MARALADKVAAIPGLRGTLQLQWQDIGSLGEPRAETLRKILTAELGNRRIALTEESSAPVLRVSLRETPSHVLLIASIHVAGAEQVRITELARPDLSASVSAAPLPRLDKRLFFVDHTPILDAAVLPEATGQGAAFLVLHASSLTLHRDQKQESLPILQTTPSRDLRGEIRVEGAQAQILLPSQICMLKLNNRVELTCQAGKPSWRGEITLISSCDSSSWQIIPSAGDWSVPDRLQATDAASRSADSSSNVLDLPGPVLALNRSADGHFAIAVVFNLFSGNYEVYRINLACGD